MTKSTNNSQRKPFSSALDISQVEASIREKFPEISADFSIALPVLKERLQEDLLLEWGNIGLGIAHQSTRSSKVAADYFKASPSVIKQMGPGSFIRWAGTGKEQSQVAPAIGSSFFRVSPEVVGSLQLRQIEDWAHLSRSIYRGTWKSGALTCKLMEATPTLLSALSDFDLFRQFASFLETVSLRSYDLALDALDSSMKLFIELKEDSGDFINLALNTSKTAWRELKSLMKIAETVIPNIPVEQRVPLIRLADTATQFKTTRAYYILELGLSISSSVLPSEGLRFIHMTSRLAQTSPESLEEFMSNAPSFLKRLTVDQLEQWLDMGIEYTRTNPIGKRHYFRLENEISKKMMDQLSSSVELSRIQNMIRMYCQALCGQPLDIKSTRQLVDKKIGWFHEELPATENNTIYLPSAINRETSKDANFSLYKVMATHQTGHIEFGSFDFEFQKASSLFDDFRVEAANLQKTVPIKPSNEADSDSNVRFKTNMASFFDLFSDAALAHDVFTIVEGSRIDSCVGDAYKGIVPDYHNIQIQALAERPQIESLPAREALVEFMIRLTLGQSSGLKVPTDSVKTARSIQRILERTATSRATVEDSAEASLRIYALLTATENVQKREEEFNEFDTHEKQKRDDDLSEDQFGELSQDFVMEQLGLGESQAEVDGSERSDESSDNSEEDSYSSPQEVDYRGDFKPELAQLLSQLLEASEGETDEDSRPLTKEELEKLLKDSEGRNAHQDKERTNHEIEELSENMMKELAGRNAQVAPDSQNSSTDILGNEDEKPLEVTELNSYSYPEWDFRAGEYKPSWCLINEKQIAEGDPGFYRQTLNDNAFLLREIKRQFEMVSPEMYHKQKRLTDGEEADFDASLEAIIDLRAGSSPHEKIYWRRNKMERSVAVAFLLDMSASTAETIEDLNRQKDDRGAPGDPVEYMTWLRSRRAQGLIRNSKRIVDVEKEGIVLLLNALEALGDDYGIYGFSGYGRENVEFYVIKELCEKFSPETTPRRIDRIAPLHATRMGPAIRHTVHKLKNHESKTRFLFLISDGRPQDRGYSREGVEKEYAVHDTRMALIEARSEGIQPFCITVDKNGHDYMRTMMDDFNYEVLLDVQLLPKRLPQLYRKLTLASSRTT